VLEHGIIDNHYISELRCGLLNKFQHMLLNSKFRTNFLKKLFYFIQSISENILTIKNLNSTKEADVYNVVYRSLKKKGANYLRQDSLYVLSRELRKGLLKFALKPKGNFIILNFLKKEYIENHFKEKYKI
jgi:hypothetical protein